MIPWTGSRENMQATASRYKQCRSAASILIGGLVLNGLCDGCTLGVGVLWT